MSMFVWLDYSEHERRKMLDVVDLFREHDTRDELGVGSVRDVFADMLFPGTSTIMTRARYFLLVPWTYLRLEKMRISSWRGCSGLRTCWTSCAISRSSKKWMGRNGRSSPVISSFALSTRPQCASKKAGVVPVAQPETSVAVSFGTRKGLARVLAWSSWSARCG